MLRNIHPSNLSSLCCSRACSRSWDLLPLQQRLMDTPFPKRYFTKYPCSKSTESFNSQIQLRKGKIAITCSFSKKYVCNIRQCSFTIAIDCCSHRMPSRSHRRLFSIISYSCILVKCICCKPTHTRFSQKVCILLDRPVAGIRLDLKCDRCQHMLQPHVHARPISIVRTSVVIADGCE